MQSRKKLVSPRHRAQAYIQPYARPSSDDVKRYAWLYMQLSASILTDLWDIIICSSGPTRTSAEKVLLCLCDDTACPLVIPALEGGGWGQGKGNQLGDRLGLRRRIKKSIVTRQTIINNGEV